MTTSAFPPLWGDISERFSEQLHAAGAPRSAVEVGDAIQGVLEYRRDASDDYTLPSPEYVEAHFDSIVEDVCERLEVDYDIAVGL